jgi:hypothetical protein
MEATSKPLKNSQVMVSGRVQFFCSTQTHVAAFKAKTQTSNSWSFQILPATIINPLLRILDSRCPNSWRYVTLFSDLTSQAEPQWISSQFLQRMTEPLLFKAHVRSPKIKRKSSNILLNSVNALDSQPSRRTSFECFEISKISAFRELP